jgi:class 3 adenylate cyclase
VAAAADAQTRLASCAWPGDVRPDVRIGIHTGEARQRGSGYVGFALIRSLRVCNAAAAGQTLLSQATENVLDAGELRGITLRDLGARELKDFDRPVRLFEVRTDANGDRGLDDGA